MSKPARFGSDDDFFATRSRFWAAFELGAGKRGRSRAPASDVEHGDGLDWRTAGVLRG
jgi:hypothetical protein